MRGIVAAVAVSIASPGYAAIDYPSTTKSAQVDTLFGEAIADPYRWLENDVRTDTRVRDWVTAQNRTTDAYLATLPARQVFRDRIRALTDYERMGTPRKAGNRYFYARNSGLQNQATLWVRDGLTGAPRLLLDPNTWAKDGATALGEWAPSDDGRFLAYAVQDGGSDWRTVRVLDAATGAELPDRIEWVKFSRIAWRPDGSGFFYSRFAAPEPGAAFQSLNLNQSVHFHRIGTAQASDMQVFATPDQPKLGHSAQVTDDGKWLVVTSAQGTDEKHQISVAPLTVSGVGAIRTLIAGREHRWDLVGSVGDKFWFVTDLDAQKGRLVRVDARARRVRPVEIIGETSDTLVGASLVGRRLVVAYLGDAKSQAELYDLDGKRVGTVPLPGIGTASGFAGRTGEDESFFTFTSFTTPATVYRYDAATNVAAVYFAPKLAFDPAAFETTQAFYPSKDGTRVPMFIVRKKGATAPSPTLLYGYGGFNISLTPGFSASRLAWVEAGGVFATANLRGGGEYGRNWHEAGKRANKQNVFDDFIAGGEYLIAQGIASKDGLVAQGGSNGGLLVGAVVNQRPDLFAAALPAVGVMDMLRFNRFTAGRYWTDDYGDPGVEADFRVLRRYSPLHNIMAGRDYPAILVTTADTDDRVVPGHSFKYTAALQSAAIGARPHLIRIETRAGHGSGKPTDKIIDEAADLWAFAARWAGLSVPAPGIPPAK